MANFEAQRPQIDRIITETTPNGDVRMRFDLSYYSIPDIPDPAEDAFGHIARPHTVQLEPLPGNETHADPYEGGTQFDTNPNDPRGGES